MRLELTSLFSPKLIDDPLDKLKGFCGKINGHKAFPLYREFYMQILSFVQNIQRLNMIKYLLSVCLKD